MFTSSPLGLLLGHARHLTLGLPLRPSLVVFPSVFSKAEVPPLRVTESASDERGTELEDRVCHPDSVNEGYLRYTQFPTIQHVTSATLSVLSTQDFF
ncbi:hypothetical protein Fmac_025746 [Flemingia macrophylla]|uniref:Uncharacterized protein n=1 Tax=Flemingia macrophylla TaxID=520843 RepID=A0ABD1LTS4_9FABA